MNLQRTELGVGPTRKRRRPRLTIVTVSFVVIGIVVLLVLFGPLLAPQDPAAQDLADINAAPSSAHLLGTDLLGRDTFSRLIVGARSAFIGPLLIALGSMIIGNILGLVSGYRGGRVDAVIMRWADFMWSIPTLLVLIVVASAVGASYWLAVGLMIALTAPFDTRVVRGATLEQVPRPYVEAAKVMGVSDRRIMVHHIWPNVSATALANAFLVFASSVGVLAALSFLGLGVAPGTPDWGLMLAENESLLFSQPLAALAPGLMLALTATSMNLAGDWIHERMSNRGMSR
ncbi:ABC transporter permease [Dactylosporangium sp. NPDC000521]|uniref:ABC transporter permease n=1 Tax=Dactylosporangium sp. NPDC000521 TaxID=3363975 RepID=UPI003684896F